MLIPKFRIAGVGRSLSFVALMMAFCPNSVLGQVNSWISPTSGSWEDQESWSLGVLPNATQSVALTNAGWKALAVDANTAQNFPQSMQIQGMQIASPADSFN